MAAALWKPAADERLAGRPDVLPLGGKCPLVLVAEQSGRILWGGKQ